jgi:hypothetical protein
MLLVLYLDVLYSDDVNSCNNISIIQVKEEIALKK